MYDDARFAAAMATGLVENDTFRLRKTAMVPSNTVIRNCTIYGTNTMPILDMLPNSKHVVVTGCILFDEPSDEGDMTQLYDLLEESNGRAQA